MGAPTDLVMIWSRKRSAYWLQGGHGYTNSPMMGWILPRQDAEQILSRSLDSETLEIGPELIHELARDAEKAINNINKLKAAGLLGEV